MSDDTKSDCRHENFNVHAEVARVEDVGAFHVDMRIACRDCGLPFEWVGLPLGFSHYQPTVSIDAQEMRVPIVPRGLKPPKGLAGFRVTMDAAGEPTQ